jgi:uncharacterized protein YkwD
MRQRGQVPPPSLTRRTWVAAFITIALIGGVCLEAATSFATVPPAPKSMARSDIGIFEDEESDAAAFLADTNQLRASKGVGSLSMDNQLVAIAMGWSQHMMEAGTLSHNPNLANAVAENWTKLGENVGFGPSVSAIHTAFVNSPHHYANLVDPAFQFVGIAIAYGSDGRLWVTEDFMQLAGPPPTTVVVPTQPPSSQPPPPPPPPATAPPVTAPPVTAPPVTAPPVTAPPVSGPRATPPTGPPVTGGSTQPGVTPPTVDRASLQHAADALSALDFNL